MTITREQLDADRAMLRRRWQDMGFFDGKTVSAALMDAAADHPATPFHFYTEKGYEVIDLATLNERAVAAAGGLLRSGLKRGDIFAVQMPPVPEAFVLHMAAAHAGLVILPIVQTYGSAELSTILHAAGAQAIAIAAQSRGVDYLARVEAASLPDSLRTVVVVGEARESALPLTGYDSLLDGGVAAPAIDPGDPQDRHLLIFSSGTTGKPKGICHSNESMLADYRIRFYANDGPYLNPMPTGHIAWQLLIFQALILGIEMISLDKWDPAFGAELIERHRVSQTGGVTVMLMGLLDAARRDGRDISSLKSFKMGGAAVTPRHVQIAEDAGITAGRFYGLSEHSTVTMVDESRPFAQRARTDGVLCPGTEVRILDEEGNDLPSGADGEIATRGPEMFTGYTDPALDLQSFLPGGWFRTGDIGHLDADGCLTITDRKKDIIIRGGENISPKELEVLLLEQPDIADVAVVGSPDERMGEIVCAVVVPRAGQSVGLEDIKACLLERGIAKFKLPEQIIVTSALPFNQNGKVQKDVLRAQAKAAREAAQA